MCAVNKETTALTLTFFNNCFNDRYSDGQSLLHAHGYINVNVNANYYMINTQTLEKDKGKIYKSNPKATIFQRKIAALGET